jgi:hypothetical protein
MNWTEPFGVRLPFRSHIQKSNQALAGVAWGDFPAL